MRSLFTEYANEGGGAVKAVQDVSFEVPEGKLFTLLGPSGCGKTTTLRSIAGLEKPTAGEIEADGRLVYSSEKGIFVAPNRRNFGMVFQSYAIWPHMNVFQNAAFPLEVRRLPKKDIREKVMRVLHAVALEERGDLRADRRVGRIAASASASFQCRKEPRRELDRAGAQIDRAVPIPRGVVRLHDEHAAAGLGDARELLDRGRQLADVLQHRHAEGRIERVVLERQLADVGGGEAHLKIVRAR